MGRFVKIAAFISLLLVPLLGLAGFWGYRHFHQELRAVYHEIQKTQETSQHQIKAIEQLTKMVNKTLPPTGSEGSKAQQVTQPQPPNTEVVPAPPSQTQAPVKRFRKEPLLPCQSSKSCSVTNDGVEIRVTKFRQENDTVILELAAWSAKGDDKSAFLPAATDINKSYIADDEGNIADLKEDQGDYNRWSTIGGDQPWGTREIRPHEIYRFNLVFGKVKDRPSRIILHHAKFSHLTVVLNWQADEWTPPEQVEQ